MHTQDHAMRAREPALRPPLWLTLLLLFVAVWLGVRIVDHVTEALTAAAIGRPAPPTPPAWPTRQI